MNTNYFSLDMILFVSSGIYLCVVMTMTSLSVIMAVMVINLYNRGLKTRRAPAWVRTVILRWLSKPLLMKHDIDKVADTIKLVILCGLDKVHSVCLLILLEVQSTNRSNYNRSVNTLYCGINNFWLIYYNFLVQKLYFSLHTQSKLYRIISKQ